MHFMLETIIAAHLLGVDAFDQPAVEEGKVLAKKYLAGRLAGEHMIRVTDTISIDDSELSESFVRSSGPGRAERQQAVDRGAAALRRAPFAVAAQRRAPCG